MLTLILAFIGRILLVSEASINKAAQTQCHDLSTYYKTKAHASVEEIKIQSSHSEEDAKHVVLSALQRKKVT